MEPGNKLANADCRSMFNTGCSSSTGSHPSGGEAGGDIKNCFSNAGGFNRSLFDGESLTLIIIIIKLKLIQFGSGRQ